MTLIDTHCHFDFPPFDGDETASLSRAVASGVTKMIVPAVTADRFERVVKLAKTYPMISAALGLHPIYAHSDKAPEYLSEMLISYRDVIVAVGEIGLDFFVKTLDPDTQIRLLNAQIRLANANRLPVILHSRRAHDALASLLKRAPAHYGGVIHGFSGSVEQAMQFVRLGYHIGVGGVITYERAKKTRQTIAKLPLSALLLETDSPDMPLSGYQGQPNRPERLAQVLDYLCDLRNESRDELETQIAQNSAALFRFT